MAILSLKNVVKQYHNHKAVDDVSFDVEKQRIFGLLGPNGAGKTSIIRIITSITGADSGEVLLDGELLNGYHPRYIGYMPEERGLYKKMKVGEQLLYLAQLKGLSTKDAKLKIDYWLKKFEITEWWHKKVEELSKGMQQKIQFVATVVHDPKLIILDEPFTGLDPINTNLIKEEIRKLKENGTSIIFSTHRMEQVEEICEDIVLINGGQVMLEGTVAQIKQDFKENTYRLEFEGPEPNFDNFKVVEKSEHSVVIQLQDGEEGNDILKHAVNQGCHIISFNEILPSLNDIFIKQVEAAN
ncbi:MAG: ATP-binding cassette domain-containing protein [Saprospiraceae bacterium]|nr:ATP-binding cassette domain-containing protein [Bacteroidia bacterium]NNE14136.1 ATP-binding cassette domain-containing protein [Saprospiraceae bacterium]NNL90951.1 ATP-binding cassette domain-containing protein [Saprospiraceae bacterium]